jgi:hypothetical protein
MWLTAWACQRFISYGICLRLRRDLANSISTLTSLAPFWTGAYELCLDWFKIAIFVPLASGWTGLAYRFVTFEDNTDICVLVQQIRTG